MFPRSHYTNDSIAEYEAQFDTRLIEEGIEVCFVEKQEKCEKTGKKRFHRFLLNGVDL